MVKETIFIGRADRFINEHLVLTNSEILSRRLTYTDTISRIDVFIMGEPVGQEQQDLLQTKLAEAGLKQTVLRVHQPNGYSGNMVGKLSKDARVGVLEDIYERNAGMLAQKDATIGRLTAMVKRDSIPFKNLYKEIRIQYPEVERLAFARTVEMGQDGKVDSIPTFLVRWDSQMVAQDRIRQETVMKAWLQTRLELDTLRVVRY